MRSRRAGTSESRQRASNRDCPGCGVQQLISAQTLRRPRHKVPMIVNQAASQQIDGIALQTSGEEFSRMRRNHCPCGPGEAGGCRG